MAEGTPGREGKRRGGKGKGREAEGRDGEGREGKGKEYPPNENPGYGLAISCHFRDCKALLVTSLTRVSGAIASVQTFTFTF